LNGIAGAPASEAAYAYLFNADNAFNPTLGVGDVATFVTGPMYATPPLINSARPSGLSV
jgi:hypothetical protein